MTPETALAWLNDLMRWLARWVPRLPLVHPTHRGVLFGPRGGARAVGPGLVLYWPMTHELVLVPVTTQSIQLSAQLLPCSDQQSGALAPHIIVCAAAVQYCVVDPVRAAVRALSLHALIDNRAQAAIAVACPFDALSRSDRRWSDVARAALGSDVAEYGVVVERLDITQLGRGVAIKNVSDWNYSDSANGSRAT